MYPVPDSVNTLSDFAAIVVHESNGVIVVRQRESHLADHGLAGITGTVDEDSSSTVCRDQVTMGARDQPDAAGQAGQEEGIDQQNRGRIVEPDLFTDEEEQERARAHADENVQRSPTLVYFQRPS